MAPVAVSCIIGMKSILFHIWNQKKLGRSLLFVFELLMLIDRRDQTMTALLTGVVVVLVVCHFPKAIMNVYECYQVINMIMRLLIYVPVFTSSSSSWCSWHGWWYCQWKIIQRLESWVPFLFRGSIMATLTSSKSPSGLELSSRSVIFSWVCLRRRTSSYILTRLSKTPSPSPSP